MSILYALVARKRDVLVEFTSAAGNFPTVTRILLTKIPMQDGRMSYLYGDHVFNYIVDGGITFLCMSENIKARIAFLFLDNVVKIWRERYTEIEQTALAFSLDDAFRPVLKERMEYYSNKGDNFALVNEKIDSVKNIMVENIDRVLERGERIELLVDKTDRLLEQSFKFEKASKSLKRDIWWRSVRNKCIILGIVLIILGFIVAMVCGLSLKGKCFVDQNQKKR